MSNTDVLLGKPTNLRTRISVAFFLEHIPTGWKEDKILIAYPHVEEEDFQAVCANINTCAKAGLIREIRNSSTSYFN